jgi:hypothetical protein
MNAQQRTLLALATAVGLVVGSASLSAGSMQRGGPPGGGDRTGGGGGLPRDGGWDRPGVGGGGSSGRGGKLPPPPAPEPELGEPLAGLTPAEQARFREGEDHFLEVEAMEEGLGPVFNGPSCADPYAHPANGGSSPDLQVTRVTRIGRLVSGLFDPLVERGGMLLQARSVREIDPSIAVDGEVVPPEATLISRRITTPLFGAGLIEAIPEGEILKRADPTDANRDGIRGVPNRVFNPETGRMEVGRFGWKAHVSTLHLFAGDAYLNEMGITNPAFPDENLPQGQPIPPGADLVPDLEDDGTDVNHLATYMRLLAAPRQQPPTAETRAGNQLFTQIGCGGCHTPQMNTGDSPIGALRNRTVRLWSDLLLHDMGPALADGMEMGSAKGGQWRTAPLWGLASRRFLLHDGRASTIEASILAHDGESRRSRERFQGLSLTDRNKVLAFLRSL